MKAMVARVTRISWVYVDALDCKSVRSIAVLLILVHTLDRRCARSLVCVLDCIDNDSLLLFHLLQHFDGKDLQQKKTLKQAKIL